MVISEDEPSLTSSKASTATSTDVHTLKTGPEVTMATGHYQLAMTVVRQGSTPTCPSHESKAVNTCKGQVATSLLGCWGQWGCAVEIDAAMRKEHLISSSVPFQSPARTHCCAGTPHGHLSSAWTPRRRAQGWLGLRAVRLGPG